MATPNLGFLDLMAFTRGAQQAEQDAFLRDQRALQLDQGAANLAATDQNLLQSQFKYGVDQFNFGLQQPVAQATQQFALGRIGDQQVQQDANREFANFIVQLNKETAAIAPEGQAGYQAARLAERFANSTNPYDAVLVQRAGLSFAQQAADRKDIAGSRAIAAQLPGQYRGDQITAAAQWNDRDYYTNPDNIRNAGGTLQPDGSVTIPNFPAPLSVEQFAALKRGSQFSSGFDTPAFLQPLAQRQQGIDANTAFAKQLAPAYEALQQRLFVGPDGQIRAVPIPATNTTALYPEPAPVRFGPVNAPQLVAPVAAPAPAAPAAPVAVAPQAQGLTPAFQTPAPAAVAPAAVATAQQPGFWQSTDPLAAIANLFRPQAQPTFEQPVNPYALINGAGVAPAAPVANQAIPPAVYQQLLLNLAAQQQQLQQPFFGVR